MAKKAAARRIGAGERGPEPVIAGEALLPKAAIALHLMAEVGPKGAIYIAADERRAEEIRHIMGVLAPELDVHLFPPWDCLPFDRASPSRDSMGRRMVVVQALAGRPNKPRVIVTSVDAVLQRVPPLDRVAGVSCRIREGDELDVDALRGFIIRAGYKEAERVGEPGDAEFRGQVVEVFPPGRDNPVRITLEGGRAGEIHAFDASSQRSTDRLADVVLGPATELLWADHDDTADRNGGAEHRLAEFYGGTLPSLFDLMPDAVVYEAPGSADRREAFLDQLREAHEAHRSLASVSSARCHPLPDWTRLYLDETAWAAMVDRHEERVVASTSFTPAPVFATEAKPVQTFQAYVDGELENNRRVVLAGVKRDLTAFGRHLERHGGRVPEPAVDWQAVEGSAPGSLLSLELDLEEGVVDGLHGITLVAAADVLGTRVHHDASHHRAANQLMVPAAMEVGDTVIHEDHGIGVIRGLETLDVEGQRRDAVRLEYRDGASVLVPVEDLDRVWRYGSEEDAVSLDRLHTDAWAKRRIEIEKAVVATAKHLVGVAEERRSRFAPKLVPPERSYAKFAARFAYPLTPDQSRAISAVLDDLASGHPMDRLVCGDVGFGKTEVALRAAAVVLMAGKQVALVAPTTVLARQHLETFRKRFAGLGFEIAGLSRLEGSTEAKRVKAGLADGSIHMVIGTHAVAGATVDFADLGLLIIDEEQKFGAKLKADLRARASDGHVLTLTATPIPRTLQMALVGVQTVSVIGTAPVRRRPVRTFVVDFDAAAVRIAFMREQARGGQSFVIVPRIEDIAAMQARLAEIVPELALLVAHGDLSAEDADAAMVGFAHGRGDVLLATNIVESGLDVPRANTMLVWDAGRFGLAQLHQLRGRVGRGRAQGVAYMLTDAAAPPSESTRTRLAALQSLDRLGAGFAISARDLDLRGAGDLVGDEQAGHVRLIGLELYQSLLARAVRRAKGEKVDDAAPPELQLDRTGRIPEAYVAEPDLRIDLYSRLSRLDSGRAIRAFRAEIDDRFGPLPPETEALLALARLRMECRSLHAAAFSVGPRAVAMTVRPEGLDRCRQVAATANNFELRGMKLLWTAPAENEDLLERAESFLDRLESVT